MKIFLFFEEIFCFYGFVVFKRKKVLRNESEHLPAKSIEAIRIWILSIFRVPSVGLVALYRNS